MVKCSGPTSRLGSTKFDGCFQLKSHMFTVFLCFLGPDPPSTGTEDGAKHRPCTATFHSSELPPPGASSDWPASVSDCQDFKMPSQVSGDRISLTTKAVSQKTPVSASVDWSASPSISTSGDWSAFVQFNPRFRDQNFSFTGHFVANPATHTYFTKKKGPFGRNAKKNTNIQQC